MPELETLHCALGDHDWQRERKRGKKPQNCPTHKPVVEAVDLEERERIQAERRAAATAERIRSVIKAHAKTARERGCKCKYDPNMSMMDLQHMGAGCKGSTPNGGGGWVCAELDLLRRTLKG